MFLPIDAEELAALRAESALTLAGSAIVMRRTAPVSDGRGGTASTMASVGTVTCLLQPKMIHGRPSEDTTGGDQLGTTTEWHALLPYGTGVQQGDQLIIGGITYDVADHNAERSIPIYDDVLVTRVL